jgi:hypothetical protein
MVNPNPCKARVDTELEVKELAESLIATSLEEHVQMLSFADTSTALALG